MASDLMININANAKNAQKAFDDVRAKTEDLEKQLEKVALVSGVAFAGLTATIYTSVRAYEEQQKESIRLTNALQNQGIYTRELKEEYEAYANAIETASGVAAGELNVAQAVAQSYLGKTKITQELTQAIADLAQTMGGDLNGAAEKIAITIGTGRNAFAKQGLEISATATEAERYAAVLQFVQMRAGGLASEMNVAGGYANTLRESFNSFQEEIGARFAPIISTARQILAGFFNLFKDNPVFTDITVSILAAATAVTGLITAGALGVIAFNSLTAAASTFGIALNLSMAGIPAIVGAVVAAFTFMALNIEKTMGVVMGAVAAITTSFAEMGRGIGKIFEGIFTLNPSLVDEGVVQIANFAQRAKEAAVNAYREQTADLYAETMKQDEIKRQQADREAAERARQQASLRAINAAELDLMRLQNENASQNLIGLKAKEIETLKAMEQEESAAKLALLRERRAAIVALIEEQQAEDIERQVAFAQLQQETQLELEQQGAQISTQLRESRLAEIQATAMTEAEIEKKIYEEALQKKVLQRNQEIMDRKKHGEAIAAINRVFNSDEVKVAKDLSSELVGLTQSRNDTLKTIGKAAAITQIGISSAESAMNVFRGFTATVPPPLGPILGAAGAAAAIAFGGERISQVVAANKGGVITGGIPGRDSVHAYLTPGELVTPEKNFEEVVGAVRMSRAGVFNEGSGQIVSLLEEIKDVIAAARSIVIQGDILADENYIIALGKSISDAVENNKIRFFGVNA